MSASNKTLLEKANAAILKGDYEGFLSYCSEDTEWTFVGEQVLTGKDAVRRYMAKEYTEPPRFHVSNLIEDGDFLVAIGEITVKQSGKDVLCKYCDVWRVRDGKLAALEAFVIKNE
jgi:uncharacterized protein